MPQPVVLQHPLEAPRDAVWAAQCAVRVDKDVAGVLPRLAEGLAVLLLLCFEVKEQLLNLRQQLVGGVCTGFGLGAILCHDLLMLDHRVLDAQGVVFEIDSIPFETQYLALAQTVIQRGVDQRL